MPSTTHSTNIEFRTLSGRRLFGEHLLDGKIMSKDKVIDMQLKPKVPAYQPAVKAILESDVIFITCGSPHGSVLSNFLPTGMKEAMKKSKAKIYLITNLLSARNETHEFTPGNYLSMARKYSGCDIDALIVPKISRRQFEKKYKDVANLYDYEHSHFLGWKEKDFYDVRKNRVEIIKHDAVKIIDVKEENTKIVRHDPVKLAETLSSLL
ncbi:MAG TPA: 2-phospho-L-lactate transferase CofD family protein [Candidatus Humimicrobiaceae bacterium]|nr:2-phospho-L-lactate transferase CofD family protein [Candidatus Humimicrobiaceae bacterium]